MKRLPTILVLLGGILLTAGAFSPLVRFDLVELIRSVPGLALLGLRVSNPPPTTLADSGLGLVMLLIGLSTVILALLPHLTRWAWVLGVAALGLVGYRFYQLLAEGSEARASLEALLANLPKPLVDRLLNSFQAPEGVVRLEYGWAVLLVGGFLVVVGSLL